MSFFRCPFIFNIKLMTNLSDYHLNLNRIQRNADTDVKLVSVINTFNLLQAALLSLHLLECDWTVLVACVSMS